MAGKTKLTIEIPAELKQDFKVYCTQNQVSMTDIIEAFLRNYLSEKGAG